MPVGRTERNGEGDMLRAAGHDKFRAGLAGTCLGTDAHARGLAPGPKGRRNMLHVAWCTEKFVESPGIVSYSIKG